jgi:hypothetical protein
MALTQVSTLREALHGCTQAIVTHLDAAFSRIWTLSPKQDVLELQASAGLYTHLDGAHARVPVGSFQIGRIALHRRAHLTNNVLSDPEVSDRDWAEREGMVAFAPCRSQLDRASATGRFAGSAVGPAESARPSQPVSNKQICSLLAFESRPSNRLLKRTYVQRRRVAGFTLKCGAECTHRLITGHLGDLNHRLVCRCQSALR